MNRGQVLKAIEENPKIDLLEIGALLKVPANKVSGHASELFSSKLVLRTRWHPHKYVTKKWWNQNNKNKDYTMYPETWVKRKSSKGRGIDPKHIKVIGLALHLKPETVKRVVELYRELQ